MNVIAVLTTLVLFFQSHADPAPPELSLTIKPTREAVAPGEAIDLLLEVDLSRPWHMYHPIYLDTGMPTLFTFDAPAGVTIGNIRYPRPKFTSKEGIESFEFAGKFTCLATLRIDKGAAPGALEISAGVSGLACVEACVPVSTKTKFTLTVAEKSGAALHADLLEKAKAAIPPNLDDAPYLAGSKLESSKPRLKVGEDAELVATIQVKEGHYVQDRDPGAEGLIGLRLFVEALDGIEFAKAEKQTWPEPKVKEVPGLGKQRSLAGEFTIRLPFKITDSKFASGPVALRVLVQYQACTEKGQCFPPELASAVLRFEADTPNPPSAQREQLVLAAGEVTEGTLAPRGGTPPPAGGGQIGLLSALIFAFLGGMLLNVMPCVLPVISIKIVSFVNQAHEDPRRVFRLGLAFCLGIMVWFWMVAAFVGGGSIALRATFQNPFQSPSIVISVATLIFLMALNMFGVFEFVLPGSAAGKLENATRKEGYPGAFMKGLLATLLGTACSAPLLAVAMAFAVTQPLYVGFAIFTLAGVGMALPYFLLCANPKWLAFVPKPGVWMITFKQAMGFLIVATAVWLLWVLRKQVGADGVVAVVVFWTFLALGAWILGQIKPTWETSRSLIATAAAVAIAVGGGFFSYAKVYGSGSQVAVVKTFTDEEVNQMIATVAASDWQEIPWLHYRPGLAEAIAKKGYTVYVDYTADWCFNCKLNLRTSLNIDSTKQLMKELRVIPIEADYTNEDPDMRRDIEADNQLSVPVNRVYPPGGSTYAVLPTILTPGIVQDALREAGASKPASQPAVAARSAAQP
ncbi:MAG: thioredoxin family protein [Phycisphaerales bacterium]|nr:thioredoxin family protein [Phycisphaerales bacterium]